MDRRQFLISGASLGLSAGTASLLHGKMNIINSDVVSSEIPGPIRKYPFPRKFWVWTGVNSKSSSADLHTKYKALKSHGIDGVFLGGGIDHREFEIVKEAGLELHSWIWTTNRWDPWIREHHPDWYMVSRSGKSCFDHPPYVDYYRWVSPVIPGFQRYMKEQVDQIASISHVDGVHLDYVRYPDVILPRGLWAKYGLDETEELPDYDFCYSSHTRKAFEDICGRDPLKIANPASDQQWLHFRYDSVSHLVKQLADQVHRHHKQITAAVFPTPRLARKMVRQDWNKWPLDAACPMTYASFYLKKVDWIGEMALENIQSATIPIYSGLYMPDLSNPEDFKSALDVCKLRGAAGVSLFGDVPEEHWSIFETNR